jgi:hypothetical protein
MSTEHQKYSIANQVDAISAYAAAHDLVIIRTYIDEAKSGLSLSGRVSLKCLLDDVQSGRADFNTVLVYDVSRWGRFQDADESAYYEYTHDGVTVPDQPLAPSAVWPTSTTETSRDCAWADLDLPACRTTAWSPKHVTHAEFLPPAELNGKGCRRFPHEPGGAGLTSHWARRLREARAPDCLAVDASSGRIDGSGVQRPARCSWSRPEGTHSSRQ